MRLLALSAATATMISFGVSAADIGYPPPVLGQDQYGLAPRPAVAPPQVIIIPAPPQYNGASVPPPGVGSSPYGVAIPVAPRVDVVPRAACPPIWRCGDRGCGWQPGYMPVRAGCGRIWAPAPAVQRIATGHRRDACKRP